MLLPGQYLDMLIQGYVFEPRNGDVLCQRSLICSNRIACSICTCIRPVVDTYRYQTNSAFHFEYSSWTVVPDQSCICFPIRKCVQLQTHKYFCKFQAGDSAFQFEYHSRKVIIDQSDMYTNVFSDLEDNNVSSDLLYVVEFHLKNPKHKNTVLLHFQSFDCNKYFLPANSNLLTETRILNK